MSKTTKFNNTEVKEVFAAYPENIRKKLLYIRELIFNTAAKTQSVGRIEETLKWGEPSYITPDTKSGSTIRIDWKLTSPTQYAIFFNCKTTLISTFKDIYGDTFSYSGNRSILFRIEDKIPETELTDCIAIALTYHLNKSK